MKGLFVFTGATTLAIVSVEIASAYNMNIKQCVKHV